MPQIPQHAHCKICGKAIREGAEVCAKECQAKLDELNRKRRRYMLLFYGATFAFILMLIISLF